MTIDTTAPAEQAEKSLREEIQDAMTASQAGAAADESSDIDASAAAAPSDGRARDAQGRFAGKQEAEDARVVDRTGQAAAAAAAAPAAQGAQAGQQAAAAGDQAGQGQAAPVPAPGNLKPELRAAWEAAPAELRKWISDREAEVHKGFTRMDEERQYGRQMRDVISPYMPIISAQGSDPVSAVKSMLNTAYILNTGSPAQKAAALSQVAQQYQIPLELLIQGAQQQPRIDPTVADLQRQVQELTQFRQQELTQREQMQQHQIQSEISAFAAAPGHEHFDAVKTYMGSLMTGGHAKDLQDAYDQAVWAHPELRQTVLAAQQQTAQQAQAAQAQARAAAAKRAAGSVSGSPGTSIPVAAPDRSLREEIAANLRASRV